jgi:hypothetical protein
MQSNIRGETVTGENPALGRKAVVAFGQTFSVVPAADGKVCLLHGGGGGGCSPVGQVADGTLSTLEPCAAGGPLRAGLLPDDATDVTLLMDDGTRHGVQLTNNVWVYQAQLDRPQPTAVTWTQSGLSREAPVGAMPPPVPGQTTLCAG